MFSKCILTESTSCCNLLVAQFFFLLPRVFPDLSLRLDYSGRQALLGVVDVLGLGALAAEDLVQSGTSPQEGTGLIRALQGGREG